MTKSQFIEKFGQEIGVSAAQMGDDVLLASFPGWDSMGRVATLALFDGELGVTPPQGALQRCVTVQDVVNLVADKLAE